MLRVAVVQGWFLEVKHWSVPTLRSSFEGAYVLSFQAGKSDV